MTTAHHTHYPSVSAAMARMGDTFKRETNARCYRYTVLDKSSDVSWHGIEGGHQAVARTFVDGYPDGLARIQKMVDEVSVNLPRAIGIGRVLKRGDQGDTLDIHAVNRGDLSRAWSTRKRELRVGKRQIDIYVDVAGNCGVDAHALAWRGVAGCTLAQIMTRAGYQCRIDAAMAVRGYIERERSSQCLITITIKPHTSASDLTLLSSTVGLTGFFRTVGFAAIIRSADDRGRTCDDGLGHVVHADGVIEPDPMRELRVVPNHVNDEASALEWVKQSIQLIQQAGGKR